jgi:two-component system, cell cycle sensor histidine kinase and response regulator CckA
MPKKPTTSDDPALRAGGRSEPEAELRRRAEARLRDQRIGQRSKARDPKSEALRAGGRSEPEADNERQLHELEVHQIELEMQNEELKDARDKMEALLEKYTDLYDFAPVGYLTLDHEGDIREANLAGASLLGIARSALVNRRFGLFVSPADRSVFDAFLEKVFESGVSEECELRLLVEGKQPVDVRMRAIVFESGQECRVAVTDITERKRAEADRLILNKLESTGILAGGIAHDFNNLLTVVLLNLELAHRLNPPGEQLVDHLETAKKSALMARDLTAQLVTFAEGGAPIRRAMFLSGLIQESVRPALSGSNVRCEFSLPEDLWAAEVDAGQIGQVIRNMVLNAREAMPQGGVVFVRAENVVLSAQEQPSLPAGEYVRVSIADQGAGIAKAVLPKIFDPYFSTKERGNQKGMGLGLTICYSVVQKHQGAIAVESVVGVGTTFHIYLPSAREIGGATATSQTGGVISQAKARKLSGGGKATVPAGVPRQGRVLVMDGEEAVRRVVAQTLWGMGHQVELAEDGQVAVEVYKNAKSLGRHFDVVILDLTVRGGMGGQEAIQTLLKIDPTVKAIAMSGYIHDPVILEPERHGFKGALAKPFEVGKLQEILSRVMGSSPDTKAAP